MKLSFCCVRMRLAASRQSTLQTPPIAKLKLDSILAIQHWDVYQIDIYLFFSTEGLTLIDLL